MSVKQASKRKRVAKAAVPALGAAGLTFSLAGGASASTLPNADTPQKLNFSPAQSVLLGEEEIADVFDQVVDRLGLVGGLVNCAGLLKSMPAEDTTAPEAMPRRACSGTPSGRRMAPAERAISRPARMARSAACSRPRGKPK